MKSVVHGPAEGTPSASLPRFLRGKWLLTSYLVFGVILFVAFLVASFPYADTVTSMLAPFKLKLVYQGQRMSPPIGARLEDVRLISVANSPEQLLLQSPDVILAPTVGSLFFGQTGLRVRAGLYGGTVRATVHQHGGIVDVNFDLNSIMLEQSDALRQFGALLSGSISGTGSAELRGPQVPDNSANLVLDGQRVAIQIVNGFPPVHLGAISGVITLENGTLRLRDVEGHGGDAEIKAEGAIQLGPDLPDSTVDLRVSVTPTARGRAHFGLFLNLLPHPPGAGPYIIRGPLMSPSIS